MKRLGCLGIITWLAAAGGGCSTIAQLQQSAGNGPHQEVFMDSYGPTAIRNNLNVAPALPARDPHAFAIGAVLPLKGPQARAGLAMQRGLQLAVAQVNASGGINGQPIQLDIVDDQGDTARGGEALSAFDERGANVLLVGDGPLATGAAEKLANFPMVIGFMCDYVAALKQAPKNGLRIYLNGDQEGRLIVSYIEEAGLDRVAIVNQSDLLSTSQTQYLQYLFSGNHSIFSTAESFSAGEKNFALLGQAMLRVNTGAMVLIGQGQEYGGIFSAFESAGWNGVPFGYADNGEISALPTQGRLAAAAAYPLPDFAVNPRSTEAGRAFADDFHAKFGADPELPAAYAYDNIRALTAAAKQAGSTEPDKIRAAFIALGTYTGAAGGYDIKADGDTEMPLRLLHADGQPVPPPNKAQALPTSTQIKQLQAPTLNQP